jgi:hypothetical protein
MAMGGIDLWIFKGNILREEVDNTIEEAVEVDSMEVNPRWLILRDLKTSVELSDLRRTDGLFQ